MVVALIVFSALAFFVGLMVLGAHSEMGGLTLLLISAVFFSASCIVEEVKMLRNKIDDFWNPKVMMKAFVEATQDSANRPVIPFAASPDVTNKGHSTFK